MQDKYVCKDKELKSLYTEGNLQLFPCAGEDVHDKQDVLQRGGRRGQCQQVRADGGARQERPGLG